MTQAAFPVDVSPAEVMRKRNLGEAIALCLELAGLEPKQVVVEGKHVDKAQWSRWVSGDEGIKWPKLRDLMDQCGNDAPLLWMVHARHYDLASLRQVENELERQNRELREENAALRRAMRSALG
ncbi:MAG TPA: hypothetical protein VF453_07670 [Burkholderiaceae bacterium]